MGQAKSKMGTEVVAETNVRANILAKKNYRKSNDLINSKGKTSLLVQKLLSISIQQAELNDKGMLTASIYGTDIKKLFGVTGNNFYETIKKAVQPKKGKPSIMDYRIIITNDAEKKFEAINVVTDCTFENGVFSIRFNDKVTKELWELKSNYTTFRLEETLSLKSIYSFRLYEILKSEYDRQDYILKKQGKPTQMPYICEMHLTDLKLKLGIIDTQVDNEIVSALKKASPDYEKIEILAANDEEGKKYKEYADLKKNALNRGKKELKEKTDIYYNFEPVKSGRGGKTQAVRFFIYSKYPRLDEEIIKEAAALTEEEKDDIVDKISEIINEKLKPREYKQIAEVAGYDIEKIKKAYDVACSSTIDRSLAGFMISAIKEDWDKGVPVKKNDGWHGEYVQQEIDFEELEAKLVEN